jgi:hypothetical protein
MTCTDLREYLADLVEGTTPPAHREAIDRHLATCEACRRLVADLRRIAQTAGTLDRLPLPPGSWSRLAARLRQEPGFGGATHPARLSWRWLAVAAGLAAAVGLGVWSVVGPGSAPAPPQAPDAATAATGPGNARPAALVETIEMELEQAGRHYENAFKALEQMAASEDSPLDPAVMATLRENLAVIDRAIDESRVALGANPEDPLAQESLLEAFRRKVGLLQDTIALLNEMRKGDQSGAARIVEGLNKS